MGPYPPIGGITVPKSVEDQLGIWGRKVSLPRAAVWEELGKHLSDLPVTPKLSDWEARIPLVQRSFRSVVQSRAATSLWNRTATEYGLTDPYVLEFILAIIATVPMPGDPVWGFIVGAPSALKTEFLRWQSGPNVYTLSRMTAHSLISGLKDGFSLLPHLDGRVLIIKDFTTVLEMDRHARDEIFAQLRDSFDGYYEGYYGSVGKLSFQAHYHVLAAVTTAVEEYYSVQSSLGQRFLKVRVPPLDAFDRSIEHSGRESSLRKEFSLLVDGVLSQIDPKDWEQVRFSRREELRPIVELLARGRTHVSRWEGNISMTPEPEMVPRLAKQLLKLAIGRALIYGRLDVDASDLAFVRRVAFDTLPLNRGKILVALEHPQTVSQLAHMVRLPEPTVYRHLEDLEALDLVSSDSDRPAKYHLVGHASSLHTPHSSEKSESSPALKKVGGDTHPSPAEPGSWMEPGFDSPAIEADDD